MNTRSLLLALAVGSSAMVSGCATVDGGQPYYRSSAAHYDQRPVGAHSVYFGRVESVRVVTVQRNNQGAGAVIGALVGGVLGNQIGSGSGRALATVGGAVAGGVIGDRVQNNRNANQGLEIVVRLDNGRRVAVIQNDDFYGREGDRVKIVGEGSQARVVPIY